MFRDGSELMASTAVGANGVVYRVFNPRWWQLQRWAFWYLVVLPCGWTRGYITLNGGERLRVYVSRRA